MGLRNEVHFFLMKLRGSGDETGLLTPKRPQKFRCASLKGDASHPPAALRRTLAVTITPVTFASGAAAPGVAFDDNRAAIAGKYVSTLGALGVPVSQRVVQIAAGRCEPPARSTPSLTQKTSGFQRLLDGRGSKDFWRPSAT